MKKIVSLFLCTLMLLSSFSIITVSANETVELSTSQPQSGITGDCKWSFDENTGIFNVSGK